MGINEMYREERIPSRQKKELNFKKLNVFWKKI
jgi:hypothetical protein